MNQTTVLNLTFHAGPTAVGSRTVDVDTMSDGDVEVTVNRGSRFETDDDHYLYLDRASAVKLATALLLHAQDEQ
jgi:hypothetical protein